ncbi:glycosyl transferase [Bordetella genomosp. 8]|uniref:Glycosyl transferase n=1 Tax=Bordetella genomosp. 8 TaxID=1416806 RepID=A0A1W6YQM8_9BORD|nr:glycosyl transferase [Bordetella genomosp. 8]ARP83406.1 glycosyl transferase [Bordetella genomosp. 8]
MQDTMQIFVGCDPNNGDLEQMMVLDYSLRKHASLPVRVHWMRLTHDPASPWYCDPARGRGWRTETWSTPFSALRWSLPACRGYQGRALYMDADMLVLDDLAALWTMPLRDKAVMAARHNGGQSGRPDWLYCVTLWDCARARRHLPALEDMRKDPQLHRRLKKYFSRRPELIHAIDPRYNCIDGENRAADEMGVLHYSDMSTQFSHGYAMARRQAEGAEHWYDGPVRAHPRADLAALFHRYYQEALDAGHRPDDYRVPAFGRLPKASQQDYPGNVRRVRQGWTRRLFAASGLFRRA